MLEIHRARLHIFIYAFMHLFIYLSLLIYLDLHRSGPPGGLTFKKPISFKIWEIFKNMSFLLLLKNQV